MKKLLQRLKKDSKNSKKSANKPVVQMTEAERRRRRHELIDEIVRMTIIKNTKARA